MEGKPLFFPFYLLFLVLYWRVYRKEQENIASTLATNQLKATLTWKIKNMC